MYAVFRSGGKQYRVSPGSSVRLEKLPGEVGSAITLDEVLMVGPERVGPDAAESEEGSVKIGAPTVDGARVTGTITAQGRGPKLMVFKMKRRKGYRRKHGHRQDYTEIRVDQIEDR